MITSKTIANGILRAIGTLIVIAIALYILYQIQSVLVYLLVSLLLTLIGNPILDFLKTRLRFNHTLATITTLLIFTLTIIGLISLFIPLILSQSENLSLLNTTQIEQNIKELINQIAVFLDNHNMDSTKILKEVNITSKINFNFIPNFLNSILGIISSFGVGLASVFFITFFFFKDRELFINGAKKLIPDSHETQILNSLEKTNY